MALPPYMFPWSQPFQSDATTTPFDPSQFAGIWNAVSGQQMGQSEAGIRRLFGESRKAAVDPYREQIRAQAAEQGRGPGAGARLRPRARARSWRRLRGWQAMSTRQPRAATATASSRVRIS